MQIPIIMITTQVVKLLNGAGAKRFPAKISVMGSIKRASIPIVDSE
ncbi:hypothetical protein ACQKMI_07205 [Lysinibacillus sp. NPDC097214]